MLSTICYTTEPYKKSGLKRDKEIIYKNSEVKLKCYQDRDKLIESIYLLSDCCCEHCL